MCNRRYWYRGERCYRDFSAANTGKYMNSPQPQDLKTPKHRWIQKETNNRACENLAGSSGLCKDRPSIWINTNGRRLSVGLTWRMHYLDWFDIHNHILFSPKCNANHHKLIGTWPPLFLNFIYMCLRRGYVTISTTNFYNSILLLLTNAHKKGILKDPTWPRPHKGMIWPLLSKRNSSLSLSVSP